MAWIHLIPHLLWVRIFSIGTNICVVWSVATTMPVMAVCDLRSETQNYILTFSVWTFYSLFSLWGHGDGKKWKMDTRWYLFHSSRDGVFALQPPKEKWSKSQNLWYIYRGSQNTQPQVGDIFQLLSPLGDLVLACLIKHLPAAATPWWSGSGMLDKTYHAIEDCWILSTYLFAAAGFFW